MLLVDFLGDFNVKIGAAIEGNKTQVTKGDTKKHQTHFTE